MAPIQDDFWTDPHLNDAQRMLLYKIQNTRKLLDLILVLAKGLVKYGGSWLGSNKNGVDLTLKRVGYRTVEELTGSVEKFFKDPGEWISSSVERCTENRRYDLTPNIIYSTFRNATIHPFS
jgi:hypothetical protein